MLRDAGITMVPGFSYKMEARLVEDATYQHAVAVNWTRSEQEHQSKAGS